MNNHYLNHYRALANNSDDPKVATLARKVLANFAITERRKRFFDQEEFRGTGWRGKEFTPIHKAGELCRGKPVCEKIVSSLKSLMI